MTELAARPARATVPYQLVKILGHAFGPALPCKFGYVHKSSCPECTICCALGLGRHFANARLARTATYKWYIGIFASGHPKQIKRPSAVKMHGTQNETNVWPALKDRRRLLDRSRWQRGQRGPEDIAQSIERLRLSCKQYAWLMGYGRHGTILRIL